MSQEQTENTPKCPGSTPGLRKLKRSPSGFFHLGMDGVLRSFNGNLRVIDYEPLNPEQIAHRISSHSGKGLEQLQRVYEGVDGRDVTDVDKLQNPGPEAVPPGYLDAIKRAAAEKDERRKGNDS